MILQLVPGPQKYATCTAGRNECSKKSTQHRGSKPSKPAQKAITKRGLSSNLTRTRVSYIGSCYSALGQVLLICGLGPLGLFHILLVSKSGPKTVAGHLPPLDQSTRVFIIGPGFGNQWATWMSLSFQRCGWNMDYAYLELNSMQNNGLLG